MKRQALHLMSSEIEKICTGCGWSSLQALPETAIACCPDSNYVPIKKQTAVDWLIQRVNSKEWQEMYIWQKQEVMNEAKKKFRTDILQFAVTHAKNELAGSTGEFSLVELYNQTFKNG